jgi:hypothetical protein
MEYPQPSAVEERLKQFAIEVGDATLQPFRVDLVRVHGGKPPIYCVVIRSFAKEPLRQRLEQLLNRTSAKRWRGGSWPLSRKTGCSCSRKDQCGQW